MPVLYALEIIELRGLLLQWRRHIPILPQIWHDLIILSKYMCSILWDASVGRWRSFPKLCGKDWYGRKILQYNRIRCCSISVPRMWCDVRALSGINMSFVTKFRPNSAFLPLALHSCWARPIQSRVVQCFSIMPIPWQLFFTSLLSTVSFYGIAFVLSISELLSKNHQPANDGCCCLYFTLTSVQQWLDLPW